MKDFRTDAEKLESIEMLARTRANGESVCSDDDDGSYDSEGYDEYGYDSEGYDVGGCDEDGNTKQR